jgi:hypothetical protein
MSLRAAIDEKCRDCTYDPVAPGTWREQVAQCSAVRCPLWPCRPGPAGGPFANPPRDPATVTREWLNAPIGSAKSGHPLAGKDSQGTPQRVLCEGAADGQ